MYTVKKLKELASIHNIPGRSKMRKAELMKELKLRGGIYPIRIIYRKNVNVTLVPSVFDRSTGSGDFYKMIKLSTYKDALFVFNDNESQFKRQSCEPGGGNAVIRPYQCHIRPRATGISTGPGYNLLTAHNKSIIDAGITKIDALLSTGHYRRVFYSANKDGSLGTSIFSVGQHVKAYIVDQLKSVCTKYQ